MIVLPNTSIQIQENMTGFIVFHLRALKHKSFMMVHWHQDWTILENNLNAIFLYQHCDLICN